MFLLARAFSSGCAALTGVEAISNGVPTCRQPKEQERRHDLAGCWARRHHDDAQRDRAGEQDGAQVRRPPRPRPAHHRRRAAPRRLRPAHRDRTDRQSGVHRLPTGLLLRRSPSPASSWCWQPTRRSTGSPSWARSWPRTATRRGPSAHAGTGWPTATASSSWRLMAVVLNEGLRRRGHPTDPALHRGRLSSRSPSASSA